MIDRLPLVQLVQKLTAVGAEIAFEGFVGGLDHQSAFSVVHECNQWSKRIDNFHGILYFEKVKYFAVEWLDVGRTFCKED